MIFLGVLRSAKYVKDAALANPKSVLQRLKPSCLVSVYVVAKATTHNATVTAGPAR
jgi:hypothetical protein